MPRTTWHHELKNGDTLLLYTDGLIEVPGTDLGEGMATLARIAETARAEGLTLAEICAQLLSGVGNRRDDAAVIGFRPVHQGGTTPGAAWGGPLLG